MLQIIGEACQDVSKYYFIILSLDLAYSLDETWFLSIIPLSLQTYS